MSHGAVTHLTQSPTSRPSARPCTSRLSRVGVTGVEKVIRIGAERRRAALLRASSSASSTSAATRRARTCRASRRSSTTSIGEVVLGEAAFRPRRSPQRIAELVRERQGARARRGHDRRALPRAQAGAGLGHPDAGDLHALRLGGRRRERGTRRLVGVAAQGMTACPCAQELVAGRVARAPARPTASPTTRSSASSTHVPVATHNQRGLGTLHIGCPEGCDDRDRGARRCSTIVEDSMSIGDLRADEALRRGRRRREGPPPPALRRGLRARDDRAASSTQLRATSRDGTFVSARQENLETIHQHNVVAERFGLLGELRHELATGEHAARITRRCASGSTPRHPPARAARAGQRSVAVAVSRALPRPRAGPGAARRSSRCPLTTVIATAT